MIYKLDTSIKRSPLLPWIHVFWCLSIRQFSQVYTYLNFPFEPPNDLRQIAHDFSLTWLMKTRGEDYASVREVLRSYGETTMFDLQEGITLYDPFSRQTESLFTNAFMHLERMGYAEAVYRWGKQTETYYRQKYKTQSKLGDSEAVSRWCYLLRPWAVLEEQKNPISPENPLWSTDLENIIVRYAPMYKDRPFTLDLLPLSKASCMAIQAIVLHHEVKKLRLEAITDEIEHSARTLWEDIVIQAGGVTTLFKSEGQFRINIHQYHMIENVLAADEMHTLEQWLIQQKDKEPRLRFILRELDTLPQQFKDFIAGKEDEV